MYAACSSGDRVRTLLIRGQARDLLIFVVQMDAGEIVPIRFEAHRPAPVKRSATVKDVKCVSRMSADEPADLHRPALLGKSMSLRNFQPTMPSGELASEEPKKGAVFGKSMSSKFLISPETNAKCGLTSMKDAIKFALDTELPGPPAVSQSSPFLASPGASMALAIQQALKTDNDNSNHALAHFSGSRCSPAPTHVVFSSRPTLPTIIELKVSFPCIVHPILYC